MMALKTFIRLSNIVAAVVFACGLLSNTDVKAQGCAEITLYKVINCDTVELSAAERNNGISLTCDTSEVHLVAKPFAPGFPDPNNGYYTYERISYDPPSAFNVGSEVHLAADDSWSKIFGFDNYFPVPIQSDTPAFRFYFYDETYSHLVANSNGGIVFYNTTIANMWNTGTKFFSFNEPSQSNYVYCPYSTSQPLPDTRTAWGSSGNPMFNSINGPFQDIYFSETSFPFAKMFISFIGEYPCRKCILSFYDVPMFGNTSQHHTSMIVLYETTNVIEFYIKDKPLRTSTNGSNAILGIQNLDGSAATTITNNQYAPNGGTPTVKSYNNTQWEAHNEAWRIKPTGELQTTVSWFKRPSAGADAGLLVNANYSRSTGGCTYDYVLGAPSVADGPTWYYCRMEVTRAQQDADGQYRSFYVWDSVLIYPLDVPDIVVSHNSASNAVSIANNSDSTATTDTICAGEQLRFNITGGDTVYFIEPNMFSNTPIRNGQVVVNQPSDVDSVLYKFCIVNYDTITGEIKCTRYHSCLIYNRRFTVDLGEDTNICQGDTIIYKDLTDRESDIYSYNYSYQYASSVVGTEAELEYVPNQTGVLRLTMTDNMGCSAYDNANVRVYEYPKLHINGNRDICAGASTTLTVEANTTDNKYLWNDESASSQASVTVSPSTNTTYVVEVTYSPANCSSKDSTEVNVVAIPSIECDQDQRICEGETAVITVIGRAERYTWHSLDESIEGQRGTQYEVAPQMTTTYSVTAVNNDTLNCWASDSMTVYIARKPIITMNYSPNYIDGLTPQVVFADSTTGVVNRLWELSDGYQTDEKVFLHSFDLDDTTQKYDVTLIGITQDGCTDSSFTSIPVRRHHHVWAPNAVYLHDINETNRTFRVHCDNLKDFSLKVFNRWGTLMFETSDPEQAWDCTYKGKNAQQGVYVWIATYHHTDSPEREMVSQGEFVIYN